MYAVTFYSFKGGVGRSLALANVAYEIAQGGDSVLVVDFDLEAPGLNTLPGATENRGLVEYVTDYLTTDRSPDVTKYVVPLEPPAGGGDISLMPAGKPDGSYARRLNAIDWNNLYSEHDGFLMFEDMKAQWKERLGVDYVLIDSRTGHTDVGGICTRQLPDAVVILFMPNDQNLYGLTKIVRDIRDEERDISLHFVMSNVPDLDDEERILAKRRQIFLQTLDIEHPLHVVHHYNSLDLLDQRIHALHRRRTRLAEQYRRLTKSIRMLNVSDRKGVLLFLENWYRPLVHVGRLDDFLERIAVAHAEDGEILSALGDVWLRQGRSSRARTLYEAALTLGYVTTELYLRLAEAQQLSGNQEGASEAVAKVFEVPPLDYQTARTGVEMLRALSPETLVHVIDSPGIRSLSPRDRLNVARALGHSVAEQQLAVRMFRDVLAEAPSSTSWLNTCRFDFAFSLIASGEFESAVQVLTELSEHHDGDDSHNRTATTFNLAMADWGLTGVPKPELFRQVLAGESLLASQDPNTAQAFSLASWFGGDEKAARDLLAKARVWSRNVRRETVVSCWRFLHVDKQTFLADLDEMERLYGGERVAPVFMIQDDQLPIPQP